MKVKFEYLRPMKRFSAILFVALAMWIIPQTLHSQVSVRDSVVFSPLIDFSYAFKIPGEDLATRFGNHSEIGISFLIKTKKNFLFGIDWNYLFGNTVKESDFADEFRDGTGAILGNNGLYSEIYFTERGYSLSGKVGKILPLLEVNPNSGVMVMLGFGILQHKIKMEDRFQEVPLLSGDGYYQGYDRLSNGFMVSEFIGYRLLSNRRLINIFGGIEFSQAWTKNRRDLNFDSGMPDNAQRMDIQTGVRLGFTLPLYKQTTQEYYYR